MSEREQRFKYRLDPLIRLRANERDVLRAEALQAAKEVQQRTRELEDIGRTIEHTEGALRGLVASGSEISVDAQLRMQSYLSQQRESQARKRRELTSAEQKETGVLSRLQVKQRDAKALELHKDKQRREFETVRGRSMIKSADDQWLLMRPKDKK
jgi:flagellar export protein FliJ